MSSDEVSDLISYVEENGGKVNKVEFKNSSGQGYGIYATTDTEVGDILIEVPYTLCLSIDKILQSPLSIIFEEYTTVLQYPDEVLAIGLMYGLYHPTCDWYKHILTMPKTFQTTIFWSDNELSEIKTSMIYHLTGMMKRQMISDWENIHEPLSKNFPQLIGEITFDDYKWALSIVYSRALGIERHGQYLRCIVPVIDMANHQSDAAADASQTFSFSEQDDCMLFMSGKNYSVGSECYAFYGNYSNSKLLYTYGFVLPNEAPRAIDFWPALPSNSPAVSDKQVVLQSHELTRTQSYDFQGTLRGGGWISPALLATLRVTQCTVEEVPLMHMAYEGTGMISPRNERAAYMSLREMLYAKLHVETAQEDRRALAEMLVDSSQLKSDAAYRRFAALVIRVEDRETVQECLDKVNSWLAELEEAGDNYTPHVSISNAG